MTPRPLTDRRLLTPMDAAIALSLDKASKDPERIVMDLIRDGKLRGFRVGRWTMVVAKSIDEFVDMEQHRVRANPTAQTA